MKKFLIYIAFITSLSSQLTNGQCHPDRHSTNWFDGWISCEESANPIASYGNTHWIMYDLGYNYVLKETKFWNTNAPKNLNDGMNTFNIDYSLDGVTWSNLGEFTLNQASGFSTYEGEEGPDFNETKARYVLITPTSNYGGDCYGFSELKINIKDPFEVIYEEEGFNATAYPNPFKNNVSLRILSLDDTLPIYYALYDILGRKVISNSVNMTEGIDTYELPLYGNTLSSGIYVLKIEQNGKQKSFKLIKEE